MAPISGVEPLWNASEALCRVRRYGNMVALVNTSECINWLGFDSHKHLFQNMETSYCLDDRNNEFGAH